MADLNDRRAQGRHGVNARVIRVKGAAAVKGDAGPDLVEGVIGIHHRAARSPKGKPRAGKGLRRLDETAALGGVHRVPWRRGTGEVTHDEGDVESVRRGDVGEGADTRAAPVHARIHMERRRAAGVAPGPEPCLLQRIDDRNQLCFVKARQRFFRRAGEAVDGGLALIQRGAQRSAFFRIDDKELARICAVAQGAGDGGGAKAVCIAFHYRRERGARRALAQHRGIGA